MYESNNSSITLHYFTDIAQNFHLEQLTFIGKHSKPPALRPDEWRPHCIVTFPSAEQGFHAFRKLREFRSLHELSWDKTNPEWIKLKQIARMKKIMDQVANTSADLAQVLTAQEQQGDLMRQSLAEHEERASQYMEKKWLEIEALADASLAKEKKDADNIKWLEHQIKSLTYQLGLKHNQNDANQKRLKAARRSHEVRLKKIIYAQRKVEQFRNMQTKLEAEAAPANEEGAEAKLNRLKDEVNLLEQDLASPTTERTDDDVAFDQATLKDYKKNVAQLEKAFRAKRQADARDHYIARSILPAQLKKQLPKPFIMDVEIKWADLLDAEYAAGNWPAAVVHDVLSLHATKESVYYMNTAEYEQSVQDEVIGMMSTLQKQALHEAGVEVAPEPAPMPQQKTGLSKYMPELRNPFKRAEV